MKNVRRVLQRAIKFVAEREEEFSCNAISAAEHSINPPQFIHLCSDGGPIEKLYREVFSYRLNRSRHLDPLLNAIEITSDYDERRELRLFMLNLFLVAHKDFM